MASMGIAIPFERYRPASRRTGFVIKLALAVLYCFFQFVA